MDGGPPVFPRDSSCPAVLWIPAGPFRFEYRALTLYGRPSHAVLLAFGSVMQVRTPKIIADLRFGLLRISVDVFSSPYLDVSVQAVPFRNLWIQLRMTDNYSAGFPHSEISGSMRMCRSPKLIAACHVLHRLLMPRHSPCALFRLIYWFSRIMQAPFGSSSVEIATHFVSTIASNFLPSVALLVLCSLFSFQCADKDTKTVPSKLNNAKSERTSCLT